MQLHPIEDVTRWPSYGEEQVGSKNKTWLRDPTDVNAVRWLFKYPRAGTGEHWAEVVAAGVARLVGIPHAHVRLARLGADVGSISERLDAIVDALPDEVASDAARGFAKAVLACNRKYVSSPAPAIVNPSPNILFVAWQSPENRAIYPIARLLHRSAEPRYEFVYVHGVRDAELHGFTRFRELPEAGSVYWFDGLPPLFTSRLMPRSRPDFVDHITRLGLGDIGDVPAPELILARSEGRKATDHIEVTAPPAFDAATRSWIYYGFARGVRHVPGAEDAVRQVQVGDELQIEPDVANDWDARALMVLRSDRARLGFVPHVLIEDFCRLMDLGAPVRAEVARVNLPPAPLQQRLLVRFTAEHRAGFAPMSTVRFEPLPADATKLNLAAAAELHPA